MRKFIVDEKNNGENIDIVLYDKFNGLTKSTLFKALRKKLTVQKRCVANRISF